MANISATLMGWKEERAPQQYSLQDSIFSSIQTTHCRDSAATSGPRSRARVDT